MLYFKNCCLGQVERSRDLLNILQPLDWPARLCHSGGHSRRQFKTNQAYNIEHTFSYKDKIIQLVKSHSSEF